MSERIFPGIKVNKITVYRGTEKVSIGCLGKPVGVSAEELKSMKAGADVIIIEHSGGRSTFDLRK